MEFLCLYGCFSADFQHIFVYFYDLLLPMALEEMPIARRNLHLTSDRSFVMKLFLLCEMTKNQENCNLFVNFFEISSFFKIREACETIRPE